METTADKKEYLAILRKESHLSTEDASDEELIKGFKGSFAEARIKLGMAIRKALGIQNIPKNDVYPKNSTDNNVLK